LKGKVSAAIESAKPETHIRCGSESRSNDRAATDLSLECV